MKTTSITTAHKHKAIGCLVGQAVGDALGAPYEFGRAGMFSKDNPPGLRREMKGGGSFGWSPAEFTDDTQMAWILAEFITQGTPGTEHLFQEWKRWSKSARDVGGATSRALSYPDSRQSFLACSAYPDRSRGNGVVMRVSPIGIAGSVEGLTWAGNMARAQAIVTHHDPRTVEASVIMAVMCAGLINEQFLTLNDALSTAIDEHVSPSMRTYFTNLFSGSLDDMSASNFDGDICLRDAVWAVRNANNFEDAVRKAVDLGGDTDTVGAVAGAIAGAMYGIQDIPARWTTYVHGWVCDKRVALEDLEKMATLLIGETWKPRSPDYDKPVTPKLVHELGVYATNLAGAETETGDYFVVSLCRTFGALEHHKQRRQFYLIDRPGENINIGQVVAEAVNEIDSAIAQGKRVLVHCHAGRSRTGLILKAWYINRFNASHEEAHDWLESVWPYYRKTNEEFSVLLNRLSFLKSIGKTSPQKGI